MSNRKDITPKTTTAIAPTPIWKRPTSADDWKEIAQYWKKDRDKHKQAFETEHQRFVAQQEMFEEINNEFNGLLRKRNVEVEKISTAEVLSDYAAHKDIQDIVNEKHPKQLMKFGWSLAFTIVALVLVWQIATNKAFDEFLSKNLLAVGLFGVIGVIVVFWMRGQTKGRR